MQYYFCLLHLDPLRGTIVNIMKRYEFMQASWSRFHLFQG